MFFFTHYDNPNYLQERSDFLQLMMNAHVNKPTEEDMADEELSHSIKFGDGDAWTTKGSEIFSLFIHNLSYCSQLIQILQ